MDLTDPVDVLGERISSLSNRLKRIEKYIRAEAEPAEGACCPWMQVRMENHVRPLLMQGWFKMKYCPNCGKGVKGA